MLRVDPISLVVLIILFYMAMFTTYQHFDNKAGRQSGVKVERTENDSRERFGNLCPQRNHEGVSPDNCYQGSGIEQGGNLSLEGAETVK